jgi:hypothetical protein
VSRRAVFDTRYRAPILNRLIAEAAHPQANLLARDLVRPFTVKRGLVEPYLATGRPVAGLRASGTWTVSPPARVLLVNRGVPAGGWLRSIRTSRIRAGRAAIATRSSAPPRCTWPPSSRGGDAEAAFRGAVKANGVRIASSNGEGSACGR